MDAAAALVLAVAGGGAGCGLPDYAAVDLQIDLLVPADDDPFEEMESLRVCLASGGETWFDLLPADPEAHLLPDLPAARDLSVQLLGLDRDPDAVRAGEPATAVAAGRAEGLTLNTGGEPRYATVAFQRCDDDCPEDCDAPVTMGSGQAVLGLRRVALEDG